MVVKDQRRKLPVSFRPRYETGTLPTSSESHDKHMAIKQLEISGYRSFKQVVWKPGSLNLVVGPNGSGKSNLLQLLALISKAAGGELAKSIADAGGMVPLLWDHQPGTFAWKLLMSAPAPRTVRDVTYELSIQQIGSGSAYQIEHDLFIIRHKPGEKFGTGVNTGYTRNSAGEVSRRIYVDGETRDGEPRDYDKNESVLIDMNSISATHVRSWTFHQDVQVGLGSPMRRPTTTQYVTKLEAGGNNLVPVLHTLYTSNRDFKNAIDDGMRAGFGDEYDRLEFQPAAAQQIQLAVQWKSSTEPHAGQDLSDGTLRFLFLLTALAHPEPPPLVAIEEPEVGLHPSMLSILAEFAEAAAERTQVVITTHSPDLLNAFTELSPVVTLCNWEDGQTQLYTLDAERLNKWLARYRLGHLFTSGELEALALPDVEPFNEAQDRFASLPPEDAALSESSGEPTDSVNE